MTGAQFFFMYVHVCKCLTFINMDMHINVTLYICLIILLSKPEQIILVEEALGDQEAWIVLCCVVFVSYNLVLARFFLCESNFSALS